jgi:hypothetical protein
MAQNQTVQAQALTSTQIMGVVLDGSRDLGARV